MCEFDIKDSKSVSSSHENPSNGKHSNMKQEGLQSKQNFFKEFKDGFEETFFSSNRINSLKGDQSHFKKFILVLQAVFPILGWAKSYNFSKFRGDLLSGITIASMQVPQDIAYAKLANLAPQYGLYSSFVPPLIYAVMGSSRELAIGPVAMVSLIMGTMLQKEFDPVKEADDYRRLAFTATFFAGIIQSALGLLRLGFLVDYLSHAATVGFMAGAAIVIALQQLKGLLGIKKFTKKTDIVSVMHSVWSVVEHGWDWRTIVLGVSFVAFLLAAKYIGKRNKKLFWVSAVAPLVSLILSTFIVYISRADKHGVKIVGHIPKGVNPSSVDDIYFSGTNLAKGFKIGAIVGVIALAEALAIGRTFADIRGYELDGNQEMVALGATNVVGSLTSSYVVTGGFARSAVNYMAGCKTAASNIVMCFIVLLTLMVITPLFKYIPNAILSSIIISAVLGLIDIKEIIRICKIDKFDFVACMGAFFGVIFHSVEIGLLIAVCLSIFKIMFRMTRPQTTELRKLPGSSEYKNIHQYSEARMVPGVLIIKVDSAIYFANSNYIRDRIMKWLNEEEEQLADKNLPEIKHLIIDMSSVADIDTSGTHALEKLYKTLEKKIVKLVIGSPVQFVVDKLHSSGLVKLIGEDYIFTSVADAVLTCSSATQEP
ncbi:high affinity sulfate transporter 2-like [Chenopodium quinoa]|uniref:STAS domain-containing protein n=1 Tax=Chenopodium quinoa TaxID=63459 RepID=A0A803NBC4_CHEQI|nr:high affinity sulfate transporter 2-like [Chenopodium quinoa]